MSVKCRRRFENYQSYKENEIRTRIKTMYWERYLHTRNHECESHLTPKLNANNIIAQPCWGVTHWMSFNIHTINQDAWFSYVYNQIIRNHANHTSHPNLIRNIITQPCWGVTHSDSVTGADPGFEVRGSANGSENLKSGVGIQNTIIIVHIYIYICIYIYFKYDIFQIRYILSHLTQYCN